MNDRDKINELINKLDNVSRQVEEISKELARLRAGTQASSQDTAENIPAYERKRNRFCLNCGTPALNDSAIYCTHCGQKLSIPRQMP